jgi:hypothetical protein
MTKFDQTLTKHVHFDKIHVEQIQGCHLIRKKTLRARSTTSHRVWGGYRGNNIYIYIYMIYIYISNDALRLLVLALFLHPQLMGLHDQRNSQSYLRGTWSESS